MPTKVNELVILKKTCYRAKMFCVLFSIVLCTAIFGYHFVYKGVNYVSTYTANDKFNNNDVHMSVIKDMLNTQNDISKHLYVVQQYCNELSKNEKDCVDNILLAASKYLSMCDKVMENRKHI